MSGYDPQCYELAEAFLDEFRAMSDLEFKTHASNLAQHIQTAIETYIECEIEGPGHDAAETKETS